MKKQKEFRFENLGKIRKSKYVSNLRVATTRDTLINRKDLFIVHNVVYALDDKVTTKMFLDSLND